MFRQYNQYIKSYDNYFLSFAGFPYIACILQKRESINISSLKVGKCNGTECGEKKGYVSWCIRNRHKIIMGVEQGFWNESLFTYLLPSYSHLHIYTVDVGGGEIIDN